MRKISVYLLLLASLGLAQCKKNDSNGSASNLNTRSVGASARELLTAANYQSVKLEIQYMPGYVPDGAALTNVVNFLNTFINKPGGITIIQNPIAGTGKTVLTLAEVYEIEKSHRTVYTQGSQLGVYLMFADAKYTDAAAVGLAYKNTSMVVFGPSVTESSGGLGQISRTKLETIVEEHEFGHLMGLVDLGTPMLTPHKDPSSNHCNVTSCLMYYSTNLGNIVGPVPVLDDNCKNDLRANGGR